jgi:proteasome accessory factor B
LGGRDGEVIELDIGTTDRLARDVAGYGTDAVVLEPAPLREEVLGRLRAHAGDGGERSDGEERRI